MPKQGLLTPSKVIDEATGLVHYPDPLMALLMQQQGLLGVGGGGARGPTKRDLDPFGISNVKLSRRWDEVPFTRVPNMSLLPKRAMSVNDFYNKNKGGVMLSVAGDKQHGDTVTNASGYPVNVRQHGGGPFMRRGKPGVWASDQVQTTRLVNRVLEARKKYKTDNVLITHATMGPHAIDFSHPPSDVMLQLLPHTEISKKGEKAIKDRMAHGLIDTQGGKSRRIAYPDFPGIYSPELADWLAGSNNRRKHFVKLMDNREMLKVGVPSPGEARLAATDLDQLGVPWLSSGMDIARVEPRMFVDEDDPHPSFPVQTGGSYEGSLGQYAPPDVMFSRWWDENKHKDSPEKSMELQGADQAIDQQWLDRYMRWHLLRMR